MILKIILLLVIISVSAYTDIKENKIKNKYLLVSLILGLVISLLTSGMAGVKDSILGIIVPFVLLFIFFVIRMFGAGDIKLFCTIGAIMGLNFVINNIMYTVFSTGIVIIIKLIISGELLKILKGMYYYFKSMLVGRCLISFPRIENGRFPFAISILIGTIIQLILNYNFITF